MDLERGGIENEGGEEEVNIDHSSPKINSVNKNDADHNKIE